MVDKDTPEEQERTRKEYADYINPRTGLIRYRRRGGKKVQFYNYKTRLWDKTVDMTNVVIPCKPSSES